MICQIIPFPQELQLPLLTIIGNVDYLTLRRQLEQIDFLLIESGIENQFIQQALNRWIADLKHLPTAKEQIRFQIQSRQALRCNLLRSLLQEDYRGLSCQLAGNVLYQWFCHIGGIDQVKVPSKSQLQRYGCWLDAQEMREIIDSLLAKVVESPKKLGIKTLDMDDYFVDTSCMEAHIHFPVDWVLLRDAVRTLMKATKLIRKEGLCCRMETPEQFLKRMNHLCMEMTHQRGKKESKKARKRVLRQMKKLVAVVRAHARRHRQLLDENWQNTQWSRKQAQQILKRMDRVLEQLPKAQEQAHERIIGGRKVDNEEKILSLYEEDVHVVVRGKAGASVEFGNTVLLGENRQGLILDYVILQEQSPGDSQLLEGSLKRVEKVVGKRVKAVATDRGFNSAANSRMLEEADIFDATCPRDPRQLKKRMGERKFARLQRRRSQTEARVGILKQVFVGDPTRAKGFENRSLALAWAVLTHNLWVLARISKPKARGRMKKSLKIAA